MPSAKHSCACCGQPLPDGVFRFTVAGDSEGGPTGSFCSIRHYVATRLGKAPDSSLVLEFRDADRAFDPKLVHEGLQHPGFLLRAPIAMRPRRSSRPF